MEGVKIVWEPRVVVYDVDKVVANVSFFVRVRHLVVAIGGHHGRNVKDELNASITPTIGEFAVLVVARVKSSRVELGTFQATQCSYIAQEGCVGWWPNIVHEYISFVGLTVANVNYADLVAVDSRYSIKRGDCTTDHIVIRQGNGRVET